MSIRTNRYIAQENARYFKGMQAVNNLVRNSKPVSNTKPPIIVKLTKQDIFKGK